MKLYEGPYDDVNEDDRVYYTNFSGEETRYIYVEITLKNNNLLHNWQCELFTKFYNDARELKGQVVRLHRVDKGEEYIKKAGGLPPAFFNCFVLGLDFGSSHVIDGLLN